MNDLRLARHIDGARLQSPAPANWWSKNNIVVLRFWLGAFAALFLLIYLVAKIVTTPDPF